MYNTRSSLLVLFTFLLLLVSALLGAWVSAIDLVSSSGSQSQSLIAWVNKITVTSSRPAGRYSGPIRVELKASDPEAKIWYTCRRNGTPADLLRYTEVITLSKSCALIYFGYITTELESRIERTDYTILYSDAVELETRAELLSLVNTGESTTDIGGWEVIAWTGTITIPAGTTLLPQARYEIGRVDPASYELRSPEGFTKSTASVVPSNRPVQVATITPSVRPQIIPLVQVPSNLPPVRENTSSAPASSPNSSGVVIPMDLAVQIPPPENTSTPASPLQSLKASTVEAKPMSLSWLGIILGICGVTVVGWFIRRKNKV